MISRLIFIILCLVSSTLFADTLFDTENNNNLLKKTGIKQVCPKETLYCEWMNDRYAVDALICNNGILLLCKIHNWNNCEVGWENVNSC